jgi:hypothetical protein
MPDHEIDPQELIAIVESLCRLGIAAARPRGLLQLEAACRRGLEALETGDTEALVGSLVAVGYHARSLDVYQLMGERMALRAAPKRHGRQKAGKTKADQAAVRARYRDLIEAGTGAPIAKRKVMGEFKIKAPKTLRKYLGQ